MMTVSDEYMVNIATRVVGPEEDIYIIQPGGSYWLYDTFFSKKLVFLDFPGLTLDFSKPAPKDDILKKMVARSIETRDWADSGGGPNIPSELLEDYSNKIARRRLGRYVGAIKRLYWDMKPGAIIVVPGQRYYDEVLIGEIVGEPMDFRSPKVHANEPMIARKVKWLRSRPRSAFSASVRDKFGKPNPITQLDRSLRSEILRAGYDQYVFGAEFTARLNTSEEDFTTLDDFNIQIFVNYVGGVLIGHGLGRRGKISFDEAIQLLREHPHLASDLKQSINSKGFQRLVADNVNPLVTAALLTAALASAPATGGSLGSAPQSVKVTNSLAGSMDPCTIRVAKRVEAAMALMKLDDWKRVCESARDAKAATGLSTTMKARPKKRLKP